MRVAHGLSPRMIVERGYEGKRDRIIAPQRAATEAVDMQLCTRCTVGSTSEPTAADRVQAVLQVHSGSRQLQRSDAKHCDLQFSVAHLRAVGVRTARRVCRRVVADQHNRHVNTSPPEAAAVGVPQIFRR